MTDHDDVTLQIVTERFERRLAEERGELRVEIGNLAGNLRSEMAGGFGQLRTEMSDGFGSSAPK